MNVRLDFDNCNMWIVSILLLYWTVHIQVRMWLCAIIMDHMSYYHVSVRGLNAFAHSQASGAYSVSHISCRVIWNSSP